MEVYAIIDNEGGWLVNIVTWDGNLDTWHPPSGTHFVLASTIAIDSLPKKPDSIIQYSAEEWLEKQGYYSTQLITFIDIERQLSIAGKTSHKMNAVRAWANGILAEYVSNPISKTEWDNAPYSFNETITEAFNNLHK